MGVVYFELCLVYVLARSQALDRHWPRLDPCLALVLDPAVAAAPRLDRSGLRKGRLCALLLRYVVICQCNGLMPIVEPEVLMDGPHTLEMAAEATRKVMAAVYKSLHDHHAFLEGSVLMPSFVRSGDACLLEEAAPAGRVALATLTCLRRTVPPAVPAVAFLSGGMGEEEAALMLNEINRLAGSVGGMAPWSLTFSFGRALQQSCLAAWRSSEENVGAAQAELLLRSKCCSLANLGVYAGQGSRGARGAPDYFLPDELAAAARRLPVDLGGSRDKSSLPAL